MPDVRIPALSISMKMAEKRQRNSETKERREEKNKNSSTQKMRQSHRGNASNACNHSKVERRTTEKNSAQTNEMEIIRRLCVQMQNGAE